MSDWAAKVLDGVYRLHPWGKNHPMILEADALAAIAKLGAGDGLVERLNRADEYEPLGHDGWEAASHIVALTAQVAEKEEQLVSVLRREAATYERHDAKMEAAPDLAELVEALEPFALVSTEGVAAEKSGYVTIITRAEYFHRAAAALAKVKEPQHG